MKQKHWTGLVVLLCIMIALSWAWHEREEKGADKTPVLGGMNGVIDGGKDDGFGALRNEVRKNFEKVAAELNEQIAARKTSGELELASAEVGDGPSMTYIYTVKKPLDAELSRVKVFSHVAGEVCNIPEMRDFMPYGVYYTYVYRDEGNKDLFSLRIDEEVCKKYEEIAPKDNPVKTEDKASPDSQAGRPDADKKQGGK